MCGQDSDGDFRGGNGCEMVGTRLGPILLESVVLPRLHHRRRLSYSIQILASYARFSPFKNHLKVGGKMMPDIV